MSKQKPKIDVFLTHQASEEYSQEFIMSLFLRKGRYFLCTRFEQNGYFADLTVETITDDQTKGYPSNHYDLSIPLHYVSYIISSMPEKALGFVDKP